MVVPMKLARTTCLSERVWPAFWPAICSTLLTSIPSLGELCLRLGSCASVWAARSHKAENALPSAAGGLRDESAQVLSHVPGPQLDDVAVGVVDVGGAAAAVREG